MKRVFRHRMFRGGALVVGATLAWHLSNFAFNSIAARILGPTSYGTLAAIVALIYVASPVFVSVQTVASRITTGLWVRGEGARIGVLARYYGLRLFLVGLAAGAAWALASSAIARFLRIPSGAPVALLGLSFALAAVTHLQRGILQGALRFGRYAVSTLAEAAMKLILTVTFLLVLWKSVDAAVLAVVGGTFAGLLVNLALLRFLPARDEPLERIAHPYRYSLATLASLVLLSALLSIDVLAGKRYLDPHEAGLYASISITGKLVFFATSALTQYLFPVFSERQERGLDARRHLVLALLPIFAVSSVLIGIYFLAPGVVLTPLFGSQYSSAGPYLGWIGIAGAAYAVVYLTAMYLLSQKNPFGVVTLTCAVLAQLAGLYAFHGSLGPIVGVDVFVFVTAAFTLVVGALTAPRYALSRAVEEALPGPA